MVAGRSWRVLGFLAIALAAFVIAAYGRYASLPFIGDDYVFLDRVLRSSFADLWSRHNADFGWYRPWSRDFHFWLVLHTAGLSPGAFRGFGFALWVGGLLLYAALVIRVAGVTTAALATSGVAALALWGSPLIWVSGSQDLWMLLFSMACLLLFVLGRHGLAAVALMGALLSKETAAIVPAIAAGYCILVERMGIVATLRRLGFLLLTILVWLFVHPTLLSGPREPRTAQAISIPVALIRTILALVNLDRWPRPRDVGAVDVASWLITAAILTAAAAWLIRGSKQPQLSRRKAPRPASTSPGAMPLAGWWHWGLWWGVVAWFPTLFPSTGWRAYYYGLGAFGMWLAIAVGLSARPRWALPAVAALALLRGPRAATPSWERGDESYLIRAGNILTIVRSELLRQHPTLAPHTRVFVARVPNNIGFIAGKSPAIRIWYRDSTLKADFYNGYRPRDASEPAGPDLFFRFDSVRVLVEVAAGPEDVHAGRARDPAWQEDHQNLALLFVRSGDLEPAAREFEKLAQLPGAEQAAMFASVCRMVEGDSIRSDSLLRAAQQVTGLPWRDMVMRREALRRNMPRGPGP